MAELVVTYDPKLEIASIVDTDNRVGFGPAMIGPNAQALLEGFLESIPYDVTEVSSYLLRDWFEAYAASFPTTTDEEVSEVAAGVVERQRSASVDEAALADHEATYGGPSYPDPQPADTDMEANESATDQVTATATTTDDTPAPIVKGGGQYNGPCFACNGSGSVPGAEEGSLVVCNLCQGTGHLPVTA